MPSYDERRYQAERNRRDADEVRRRYGDSPRALAIRRDLMEEAENLERQNDRERHEMRYRENPGPYNPQDYPRNEYDEMEMRRRRDSRGRYMEYDYPTHMMVGQPYHSNAMPSYYPNRPYMNQGGGGGSEYRGGKIGFAGSKERKDKLGKMIEELEQYGQDYQKHKQLYEQSKSPEEAEHMKLELEEFSAIYREIYKCLMEEAKTPQEKQILQQMAQKMMQP